MCVRARAPLMTVESFHHEQVSKSVFLEWQNLKVGLTNIDFVGYK